MQNFNRIAVVGFLLLPAMIVFGTPAFAQIDLVGEWAPQFHEDQPERVGGPNVGDYAGLPINDAARFMAEAWDADILSVPEHQCKPHPADYSPRGPANLRFWKEVDTATQQVIALHTHISWQAPERTIWMDGRPHPDEFAAHTWQGFSTGTWEGGANSQVLKVVTTHLKKGWIRRNGVPRSDEAELTEYFFRHSEFLTWTAIINDPLYLTEPMIRTSDFRLAPNQNIGPYPCLIVSEVEQPHGWVPHYLAGENPVLEEFAQSQGVPAEAMRGGAATMLPEFRKKSAVAPPK
jgi:hypothetical protein